MNTLQKIWRRDIKLYMIVFLSLLALWGMVASAGFAGALLRLLAAVGTAALLDLGIHYFQKKKWLLPKSAIISGLLIGSIISPRAPAWLVIIAAAAAIGSKHLIRIRGRHIFNPAIFGLLFVSVFFSAPLAWWGSSNLWVVLIFGAVIAAKLKRFHLLFAYAIPFALLMGIYALANQFPVLPQVMFLNFYFLVFMVVEPKTSPMKRKGRLIYGALAAAATFIYFLAVPQLGASIFALVTADLAVPFLNRWESKK